MSQNSKGIDFAAIIPDRCIGCQICAGECPVGAIEMSGGVARIDPEVCIGCGKCFEVCPVEAVSFEPKRPLETPQRIPGVPENRFSEYRGVAVFIEVAHGQVAPVSWELAGKARELSRRLGTVAIALIAGHELKDVATEALEYGCDEVHVIDDALLGSYFSRLYGKAVTDLANTVKPEILLMGATALGRDLASVVATNVETGLTADCTGLDIDEEKRLLLMTRPAFGGNIMATIFCENHRPQMSTVRPGVFRPGERKAGRTGAVHHYPFVPPAGEMPEILEFVRDNTGGTGLDIGRFPALVVVGKGACDPESMPMFQELADLIGGVVACSRPVVEAGLMPYERQVGQTGKTVAPKLYFAIGVSGAVQHLVGMQGSRRIAAINSDPHAPIFGVSDTGLIGDYRDVVPLVIKGLRGRFQTIRTR